jgi:hypothetical protein
MLLSIGLGCGSSYERPTRAPVHGVGAMRLSSAF